MIYCKIDDNLVVDRAVFDTAMPSDWPDYAMWVQNDEAQIGWTYTDDVFAAPVVPPPEPLPQGPPAPDVVILLNHENRIRSQEGVPPLTMDDFRTANGL